jgi:FixJ family two-component response regulator
VGGGAIPENLRLRLERLTRRERQVLDAMVRGDGNKAIAHDLGISPRTVEVHRAKVMEKLSCRSLPDVVRLAVQAGLMRA